MEMSLEAFGLCWVVIYKVLAALVALVFLADCIVGLADSMEPPAENVTSKRRLTLFHRNCTWRHEEEDSDVESEEDDDEEDPREQEQDDNVKEDGVQPGKNVLNEVDQVDQGDQVDQVDQGDQVDQVDRVSVAIQANQHTIRQVTHRASLDAERTEQNNAKMRGRFHEQNYAATRRSTRNSNKNKDLAP